MIIIVILRTIQINDMHNLIKREYLSVNKTQDKAPYLNYYMNIN